MSGRENLEVWLNQNWALAALEAGMPDEAAWSLYKEHQDQLDRLFSRALVGICEKIMVQSEAMALGKSLRHLIDPLVEHICGLPGFAESGHGRETVFQAVSFGLHGAYRDLGIGQVKETAGLGTQGDDEPASDDDEEAEEETTYASTAWMASDITQEWDVNEDEAHEILATYEDQIRDAMVGAGRDALETIVEGHINRQADEGEHDDDEGGNDEE